MGWIKRNLFVIIAVAVALCALGALALESMDNLGVLPPAERKSSDGGDSAAFQNRTAPASEIVKAWPEYGDYCDYDLALELDPDARELKGTLDFTYRNAEDRPMSELHFLLYANSFEKEHYEVFEAQDMERAYPNGFSPGSIRIVSVTSPDGKAESLVTGEQSHVLQVRLPRAVEPGQSTRLTIKYTVTIPNCYGRFGYGNNTMSLVNCNPILSVYDGGEWHDYVYYNMGDPFYSETADYTATIRTPEDWTIAATGVLTRKQDGDTAIWKVDAPARRDFGFVASDRFEVMQQEADGVLVRSYYLKGSKSGGRAALDCGVEAIGLYTETFGEYPYAEFSVVETDFFIGGMEYPGMVLIDHSLYAPGQRIVQDLVVAHETAHQWWYSTIGGNEVTEPWLDEGLTEFSTQYFFEKERDESYNNYYGMMNESYQEMRGTGGEYSVTMKSPEFEDSLTYAAWVYDRAAQIMKELRGELGDEVFFEGLRQYYGQHRLAVATRADLEEAFEKAAGRELTQWFEERFSQPGNE